MSKNWRVFEKPAEPERLAFFQRGPRMTERSSLAPMLLLGSSAFLKSRGRTGVIHTRRLRDARDAFRYLFGICNSCINEAWNAVRITRCLKSVSEDRSVVEECVI